MEAAGTEGMVREPSAEVAAKAKRRSAARDSKGRGAEQRGGTERQDRDAIACGSLLKIVSHGITLRLAATIRSCLVGGLSLSWRSSILLGFTRRLRAFTARSFGPHTPAA
jgi:hypothetical protein